MNGTIDFEYPNSKHKRNDSEYKIVKSNGNTLLYASGSGTDLFDGQNVHKKSSSYKLCPLTVENARTIRKLFDFTNPKSHKGHNITIGLGDRLGLASPGHIHAVRDTNVFPVLAQQSMRELDLTGRTYDDVLAAAAWAVFREGYTNGYGADGDHLKTHDEVKHALDCGFTMITLDCSEHINNDFTKAPQHIIDSHYELLHDNIKKDLEKRYVNKTFTVHGNIKLNFCETEFRRIVLIYLPAVNHAVKIFNSLISGRNIDFEISIDETLAATTPQAHYFTANELILNDVDITSLAPRFAGEFQKGIDYIGDINFFEIDFAVHARIAETFGYKISVHSSSDKFSIFPYIGRLASGRYHLKTAGTSWLEAVRVIAGSAPDLYRKMHIFALKNLRKAKKYYHITENRKNIPDIKNVPDSALIDYLGQDDARRVLHITYGLILTEKARDGTPLYRNKIYETLDKHEQDYSKALKKHIRKHLRALGI